MLFIVSSACRVSFTDNAGVTHTVSVSASSLYEAAALGIAEFRRCGFAEAVVGPATRLKVAVAAPSTAHELPVAKLRAWLESNGKTPKEQAVKVNLRELMVRGVTFPPQTYIGAPYLAVPMCDVRLAARLVPL